MFRTLCIRGLLLVLIHAGAPPASAASGREPEGLSASGILSTLWETLAGLLPDSPIGGEGGSTTDGGPDGGPHMDPNGKPPKP